MWIIILPHHRYTRHSKVTFISSIKLLNIIWHLQRIGHLFLLIISPDYTHHHGSGFTHIGYTSESTRTTHSGARPATRLSRSKTKNSSIATGSIGSSRSLSRTRNKPNSFVTPFNKQPHAASTGSITPKVSLLIFFIGYQSEKQKIYFLEISNCETRLIRYL